MSTEVQSQNIPTETLKNTKAELAEMYVDFLDKQKWWLMATWAIVGVNINPLKKQAVEYLTSDNQKEPENILSTIGNNIKKTLTQKILWNTWIEIEYDKARLDAMKQIIIANKNNETQLQELKTQIALGVDPTLGTLPATTAASTNTTENTPLVSESVEEITDRRKAVVTNINAILEQDKKTDIEYNRWGHTSIEAGLDCGGLLVYASAQAGLKVGGNGRELFQKFPSKKLEVDADGKLTTDVSQFQEGDVLIYDSLDPAYHDTPENRGRQHEITWTDGQKIHPHHFAYIKSFDRERGIVNIIESNGSQGVTESECSIAKWLDENQVGKRKSALHAIHVNYDKLEKIPTDDLAKLETLPGSQLAA